MTGRALLAVVCASLLAFEDALLFGQQPPAASTEQKKVPPDQLDSLVAPIALYPDDLLAQTLAASTYPLEIIQLKQWMEKNKNLKDKALVDAVAKQPWDPAVQSMAAFPEVVKRLGDDVQWTLDLGNAVLAQESDVMDAVQRMRKKAKDKGTLKTTEQQKVETQVIETKEVIVIQPANPQVIYVPAYDPVVIWGPPIYPYPPIYYPYYYPGAAFVSFGIGLAWGAFWGGMWGGCGWGGSNININVNNNFNRVDHRGGNRGDGNRGGNRPQAKTGDVNRGGGKGGGGGSWKHNPQHRGGTPYGDRATANKFGGSARGDSLGASRQASASQALAKSGGAGAGNRAAGAAGRGSAGVSNRAGGSSGSFNRSGSADRIGGRDVGGGASRGASGFGGGYSGGFNGSRSRASSSRGASSFGSRGGGGGGRRR